jgi:outer membrane protein assembly factor BamA
MGLGGGDQASCADTPFREDPLILALLIALGAIAFPTAVRSAEQRAPAPAVAAIEVGGLERTRLEVVTRELRVAAGDPASRIDCTAIAARLENLGLFSAIDVRTEDVDSTAVILVVDVSERPRLLPYPIAALSEKSGVTGGAALLYSNPTGRNDRLEVALSLGGVRGAHARYANPWLAGNHLSAGISASFYREENRYEGFTEETGGVGVTAGSYLSADGAFRLSGGASYMQIRASEPGETISPDNRDRIHAVTAGLAHDTRDLYRNPHRGHRHAAGLTVHGYGLGGTVDYTQLVLDLRHFHPLSHGRALAVAARGVAQPGLVPGYRQLRLGGANMVRGVPGAARAGDHALVATVEWRFDVAAQRRLDLGWWILDRIDVGLAGALFADAGAVYGQSAAGIHDPLTRSDVAWSAGGGLRLLVPWVDVLRLDVAVTDAGTVGVELAQGMKF